MSLRSELDRILSQVSVMNSKVADDPLTDLDWNIVVTNITKLKEAVEKIRDLPACTIPKGFLYVRFPGQPLPYGADGMFNWTKELDWKKLDNQFAGCFLRISGDNASAFSQSGQVQFDTKARGTGGGQWDALQTHGHLSGNEINNPSTGIPPNSYTFFGGRYRENELRNNTNAIKEPINCKVDIETRPINITVEMYLYMPD